MAPTRVRELQPINSARNSNKLYPMNCEAVFRLLSEEQPGEFRHGRVVGLSNTNLQLDCRLPAAAPIEVIVPWPMRMGGVQVKLHALGRTVTTAGIRTEVSIEGSSIRLSSHFEVPLDRFDDCANTGMAGAIRIDSFVSKQ